MSHEIRIPLNGVLGGVQLLQAPGLRPEQRQPVEIIARNGDLLARLLDDLLDLARIETGHLSVTRKPSTAGTCWPRCMGPTCRRPAPRGWASGWSRPAPRPPPWWATPCACVRCWAIWSATR